MSMPMPVTPDDQALNDSVLPLLEKLTHLNHLKQLQSHLISLGQSQTQFFSFKLIRFCTLTLNNFSYAHRIFNSLTSPNVYLYTALITAYASSPLLSHHAVKLYRDMIRRRRPKPNHFIFPHVLKCESSTTMMHAQIVRMGYEGYPVVQTGLIDSYLRSGGDTVGARKMFDEMTERNVVSWTVMISGYMRVGQIGNAFLLFEEMKGRDIPAWNSMIAGCAQNGLFPEAIFMFRRMVNEGRKRPNHVTILCALSACSHGGMLQLGKGIHCYVYRNAWSHDMFVLNALVDMYGKCGNLKVARRIFDTFQKRSLTLWNAMINCYALHGQSQNAIGLFKEMIACEDNVEPDEVTFIGLLTACTHGGLVEEGWFYYELMTGEYGIEPQIEHYGCLIDLLGRAGKFEETMRVISSMKMEPDEVVWGSLLNGCKVHGRTDLAELAVKKLLEIVPENGGYGTMLANIYGELGKWDKVREVRKMLKKQDAHKTPGCSWIEIDSLVHQFYSVDKSHREAEDIYKTLESLTAYLSIYEN